MSSFRNKSKKLVLFCIILTYICLAVACRSNGNDSNLNSGDMAGTENTEQSPSPLPNNGNNNTGDNMNHTDNMNGTGTMNDNGNMNGTDNTNGTDNNGVLDNAGNAAQDVVDGIGNGVKDVIDGVGNATNDIVEGNNNNTNNNNVNSVTEGTR